MPKVVDPATRRTDIADAVRRVIARDGIEHASLRGIALEAGLAVGSVRHYFDGYEELLNFAMKAYIDRVSERLLAHAARLAGDDANRREIVEDMLFELLPIDEPRREESLVWLELTSAARKRPELAPHAADFFDGTRALVRRILTRADERGRLATGLDIALETERLAAVLDGLVVNGLIHPDRLPAELMRDIVRAHLDSLGPDTARPTGPAAPI